MPTCTGPHDADRPIRGPIKAGLCPGHYSQQRKGKPLTLLRVYTPGGSVCIVEGCDGHGKRKGLCNGHRKQARLGRSFTPIRPGGRLVTRSVTSQGYVRLWEPEHPNAFKTGWVAEHVKVMSNHIGRPLLPTENVHHRNGVKDDNRLANLELWTRSQPSGQRVADKVAWAVDTLKLYRPDLLRGDS